MAWGIDPFCSFSKWTFSSSLYSTMGSLYPTDKHATSIPKCHVALLLTSLFHSLAPKPNAPVWITTASEALMTGKITSLDSSFSEMPWLSLVLYFYINLKTICGGETVSDPWARPGPEWRLLPVTPFGDWPWSMLSFWHEPVPVPLSYGCWFLKQAIVLTWKSM